MKNDNTNWNLRIAIFASALALTTIVYIVAIIVLLLGAAYADETTMITGVIVFYILTIFFAAIAWPGCVVGLAYSVMKKTQQRDRQRFARLTGK